MPSKDRLNCAGHRGGGLACSDDNDPFKVAQIVAATPDGEMISVLAKRPSECGAGMSACQRLSQHVGQVRTRARRRNPDQHGWALEDEKAHRSGRLVLFETAGGTALTRDLDLICAVRQEIFLELGVQ